jgi:hypothetical protein
LQKFYGHAEVQQTLKPPAKKRYNFVVLETPLSILFLGKEALKSIIFWFFCKNFAVMQSIGANNL